MNASVPIVGASVVVAMQKRAKKRGVILRAGNPST
jgi:hypothetical protein